MTKNEALKTLIQTIDACDLSDFTDEQKQKISDAIATAQGMSDKLSQPRESTPADKAKAAAKRATARAEAIKGVLPVVLQTVTDNPDHTAAEIYALCADALPAEWNVAKVQYLLLHELADRVAKAEAKGKPNTYRLAE